MCGGSRAGGGAAPEAELVERAFHEVALSFPAMPDEELAELVASIAEHGVLDPIWVDRDGLVLDGRHRWLACRRLGIACPAVLVEGDPAEVERKVIAKNDERRHYTFEQRVVAAARRANLGVGRPSKTARERAITQAEAARRFDVGRTSVQSVAKAEKAGAADLIAAFLRKELTATEVGERLDPEGRRSLKTLHNMVKHEERAEKRAGRDRAAASAPPNPVLKTDRAHLHPGDFRELAGMLGPSSVDCIITDPPYPREALPLYDALGEVAARVLRPGGRMLVMIDGFIAREVLNRLHPHLGDPRLIIAYLTPGASTPRFNQEAHCNWKPVLAYERPPGGWGFVRDTVQGGGADKRFHGWQQDVAGFEALVERFTAPGELVFDPFTCSGTTGVAALRAGRLFVGAEIDPSIVPVAAERLALAARGLPDEIALGEAAP